jgi:hypothetical protein
MMEDIEQISEEDRYILGIIKYNRLHSVATRIDKRIKIGKYNIHIEWKTSVNLWGRFGGGWNWKIGIMWSKYTVIFNLLVMSIRINKI